jgi:hypothetical protein
VPLTELVAQAVHTVAAGFKVSTKLESDSRRAGAEAILATDLPIDWGCWDELEREILDARG